MRQWRQNPIYENRFHFILRCCIEREGYFCWRWTWQKRLLIKTETIWMSFSWTKNERNSILIKYLLCRSKKKTHSVIQPKAFRYFSLGYSLIWMWVLSCIRRQSSQKRPMMESSDTINVLYSPIEIFNAHHGCKCTVMNDDTYPHQYMCMRMGYYMDSCVCACHRYVMPFTVDRSERSEME